MAHTNSADDRAVSERDGDLMDPSGSDDGAIDARIYRILGEQFLTPPDRERVDAIARWAREWRRTDEALPVAIEKALDWILNGSEADLETLQRAYTHLFRGVSRRDPDPPYESLYVQGQFNGATTTEIERGYRWVGLNAPESELPDHLGLELQFLGELTAMVERNEGEEGEPEKARWWLLNAHLTEWLPAYHARLQREEPVEYYAGLIDLALAVVTLHHDLLRDPNTDASPDA
ncbi:TorD/DmsD family molecular chaperone [Salinibacter altiplanensis]|uniref:TorD/DmsD family molecular chaperone n=1 Tax=Salinibacter altiplanensis TaxID=1803181 RepID=UPI000C9EC8D6|nr:molecular chaperone TorD family protein [Salinibacter altiplanensis]